MLHMFAAFTVALGGPQEAPRLILENIRMQSCRAWVCTMKTALRRNAKVKAE